MVFTIVVLILFVLFTVYKIRVILNKNNMAMDQVATVEVRVNGERSKAGTQNLETIASGLKKELADAYQAGDNI